MNKNIAVINTIINSPQDQNILVLINDMLKINKHMNANVYTTAMNMTIPNKKFGILPIYEGKYFQGKAIVWDLISLNLVYGFPNISEIIYLHNNTIPWRDSPNIGYKVWDNLFINSKLKMIITDPNIYEIFKLTWDSGIYIETMDTKTLYENI